MGLAWRRGGLCGSRDGRGDLLRFAFRGVICGGVSERIAAVVRKVLARRFRGRPATCSADAATLLWQFLGCAVHRAHDRIGAWPSWCEACVGRSRRRRARLRRSKEETRQKRSPTLAHKRPKIELATKRHKVTNKEKTHCFFVAKELIS